MKRFIGVEPFVQVSRLLSRKCVQTSFVFVFFGHQVLDPFTPLDAYRDHEKTVIFGKSFFLLIFHIYFSSFSFRVQVAWENLACAWWRSGFDQGRAMR